MTSSDWCSSFRGDASVEIPESIRNDLGRFVELAQADDALDPKTLGVPFSRDEALALLRSAYGLT